MTIRYDHPRRTGIARGLAAALCAGALVSGAMLIDTVLVPRLASAAPANDSDDDGDGLTYFREVAGTGTDPYKFDTDGDVLGDGQEVNELNTDPKNKDTDGDGDGDGAEFANRTSPLDPNSNSKPPLITSLKIKPPPEAEPAERDTDGDGLSDRDELKQFTNVFLSDTDFDGVSDGDEVANGTSPLNVFSN